jgi:hypothetical protein
VADLVMNIALGRVAELYNRVDSNDPANSALIVAAFAAADTDASIRDCDTLAAIEALASTAEATNSGYARKTLTDADLTAFAPDDTNDRVDLDIPDQTWTAVAAGSNWTDILIAYDSDTTAGTDSAIVPLTWHDFVVTPGGSDIVMQVAAAGFYRASPV